MSRKRIIENSISLGVVQIVNLGLPLLWLPYLARVLGAEQLGRVAFALSIAQMMVVLTDYGFNLSASKAVAVHRSDKKRVAEIWCSVSASRAILAFFGLIALLSSSLVFDRARDELALFLAAYVMVIGNILYPQWLFQGLEKLRLISVIQVVSRLVLLVLIVFFVKSEADVYWAVLLQAGGGVLGGLLAIPLIVRELDRQHIKWPSSQLLLAQFKDGWHVFLSTAAITVYTSLNSFILGLLVTPTILGYYHIAEKLIRAVQSVYGAISNAIYPHVSRLAAESTQALLIFNKKLFIVLIVGALVFSMALHELAPLVVSTLFGQEYLFSATILQILSPVFVIIVASNVLGIQTMLPLGMESTFSRILIIASLVNLCAFIPSASLFGVIGAAWANLGVELFVTFSMLIALERAGRNPISFKKVMSIQ